VANGIASCDREKGRNESMAIVATWSATNVPTRSPPARCTSSTANMGHRFQRRPGARPAIVTPITTTALRRR
jgi:hypothetical protein